MISIIVPVYKVEPYLRKCLDSILAQTYTDFELILVDDGSPDRCGAICDEYAQLDARIRVLHQKNGGISAARNAGLDVVQGEYLTFIDSDDMVSPAYLEDLLHALLAEQADISVCGMLQFTDGTEPAANSAPSCPPETISGREACLSIYRMDGKVWVTACGKLYRTALFTGIRFPLGRIHEDQDVIPQVLYCAAKVTISTMPLYLYRLSPDSITRQTFSSRRFDDIEAVRSCISFFAKKNDRELVQLAKNAQKITQAKLIIYAHVAERPDQIPTEYRMGKWRALWQLRKLSSFSWYLSLIYPKLVRPYAYLLKIKQILAPDR